MSKNQKKRIDIVSTRIVRDSTVLYHNRNINTPQAAVDLLRLFLDDADREQFVVIGLTTKNTPTTLQIVSIGSLSASIVHPREVFKVAISSNSASVILSHNHPSGDTSPSTEDIETTKRLVQAGEILGIKVLDHVIISTEGFYSLKESGML